MNEITTTTPQRGIKDITEEIIYIRNAAQNMALLYACEIGRRLTEAKALLKHGEWLPWLEEKVLFSQRTAQRLMRLYAEYGNKVSELGANPSPLSDLSVSNALSLLAVPEEERESFAEEHNAAALPNSELEKLIKERDEAIKRAEEAETAKAEMAVLLEDAEREAENQLDEAKEQYEELEEKLKGLQVEYEAVNSGYDELEKEREALEKECEELRSRPVDVAVEVDEEAVKKAAEEARAETEKEWKAKLSEAEQAAANTERELDEMKDKLRETEEKLEDAGADDRAEKERLEKEVENLSKRLMMSDRTVAIFQVHFDSVQKAWTELRRLLDEMSTEQRPKMGAALKALAAKINEEAAKC